jgi:hypothetical protein
MVFVPAGSMVANLQEAGSRPPLASPFSFWGLSAHPGGAPAPPDPPRLFRPMLSNKQLAANPSGSNPLVCPTRSRLGSRHILKAHACGLDRISLVSAVGWVPEGNTAGFVWCHEVASELIGGADFWCSLHCNMRPVVLDVFGGHSLAETQPNTDPQISSPIAVRYPIWVFVVGGLDRIHRRRS